MLGLYDLRSHAETDVARLLDAAIDVDIAVIDDEEEQIGRAVVSEVGQYERSKTQPSRVLTYYRSGSTPCSPAHPRQRGFRVVSKASCRAGDVKQSIHREPRRSG